MGLDKKYIDWFNRSEGECFEKLEFLKNKVEDLEQRLIKYKELPLKKKNIFIDLSNMIDSILINFK